MNEEIQNHALLFSVAVFIARSGFLIDKTFIVIMLLAFCIDAACLINEEQKFYIVLSVIYLMCCMLNPIALSYLPVILYWSFKSNLISMYILSGAVLLISKKPDDTNYWIGYVLLIIISLLLEQRTTSLLKKEKEYKVLRDTSVEYSDALKMRNRELLEKQDNEIYVATLLERNRIAREIHDNVGHMLSRSILLVGALISMNKDENMKEGLGGLKETLDQAMNGIRDSVHDLHDDSVDLKEALKKLVDEFCFCDIEFDYDMGRNIPKNIKYCFIALTKEALSNIMRHSDATKVEVVVREHPGIYQLLISDNGTKELNSSGDGIGIDNMKKRVTSLQGTMTISIENGYRIFVSIPKSKERKA